MDRHQFDAARVIEAAQRIGAAIKPVMSGEEGTAGRIPWGSAFVLEHNGQYAAITADHVVSGPVPRYLGVSETGAVRWPAEYVRMRSVPVDAPDPDVGYALLSIDPTADPDAAAAIPLREVVHNLRVASGMSLLAVGHPVSKGKMRYSEGRLRTGLAHLSGIAVAPEEYAQLKLDPRVHLAMRYERDAMTDRDGNRVVGPEPDGMSGGVLFLPTEDEKKVVHLLPAGIITSYRPGPPGLLIASRIEAVLDVLAPGRPPEERIFARAV